MCNLYILELSFPYIIICSILPWRYMILPTEHPVEIQSYNRLFRRIYIYIYIYIYNYCIYIDLLDRYSGILQGFSKIRYPLLFFLNFGKANLKEHLSAAASEGWNCLVFRQLLTM